jgi:transcriptional regulator with XRE-family HTH domain
MGFGARLQEERRRLGFKQAEFSELVGSDVPKQSLYETDKRQLRAAYLARTAAAGVDLLYVITGRRSEGDLLGEDVSALLSTYLGLPEELRETVDRLVGNLAQFVEQGQGPTIARNS